MNLTQLANAISNYKMVEVNLQSVLGFKKLSNSIELEIKRVLWDNFEYNLELLKLNDFSIKLDKELLDRNDYPKNIVLIIREKVYSVIKMEQDENTKIRLKKLVTNLENLYIEYEDAQEELEEKTNYLFNMIDEKFQWLDNDEEFEKIAELLEKISKEICDKIKTHIELKRKFYTEYVETTFKIKTDQDLSNYSKQYVNNYIKTYVLKNFGGMFDQICLDVIESNGITEQNDISSIIGLYYDYTKLMVKLYFAIDEIDMVTEMYNNHISTNTDV